MALAVDTTSTKIVESDTTSTSWSHTCSGANRVLIVGAITNSDSASATYNGVAMTKIVGASNGNGKGVALFRLVAPATGANTVAVSDGNGYMKCFAISFTGANQDTPVGTANSATGNSNAPSVSISSGAGEIVVDAVNGASNEGASSYTPGAGQTEVLDTNNQSWLTGAGSYEAGAASVTMSWTWSRSAVWAIVGVSVKAAPVGGSEKMLLLGVG